MASDGPTRVEDVMSTPLEMIAPDESVKTAAEIMREHDIAALVVTASRHGIITSTDIIAAVADGKDLTELTVEDVMTEEVETVTPDLYMEEVAAMLTTYGIKHLPVVDDDFVGMVSSSDVAAHLS
ncbi:MAG: cyclic nucleotide-binding/CBS domain-containing protein [Halanaeroarchaeum sp.]